MPIKWIPPDKEEPSFDSRLSHHHIEKEKYYFDDKAAKRAVDFIETFCKHIKGDLAGKPFILEDWQKKDIIEPLFGWKSKETNLRKFRQCFVFIPRKNGKTNQN